MEPIYRTPLVTRRSPFLNEVAQGACLDSINLAQESPTHIERKPKGYVLILWM